MRFIGVSALFCGLSLPVFAGQFFGLGDIAGGPFQSYVAGISGNGQVVVGASAYFASGRNTDFQAFRWSRTTGMVPLGPRVGDSGASAASFDGSVIIGVYNGKAARFNGAAVVELPILTNGDASTAYDVSDNGSVTVGASNGVSIFGGGYQPAWWGNGFVAGSGGLAPLSYLGVSYGVSGNGQVVVGEGFDGNTSNRRATRKVGTNSTVAIAPAQSIAVAANQDGSVIVGTRFYDTAGREGFRWTAGGITYLGDLPGGSFRSDALAVSADGAVVVGSGVNGTETVAFIWRQSTGIRDLKTTLQQEFGVNVGAWRLREATAISADGRVIAGTGINPSGQLEGWVVYLDSAPGDTDANGCVDDADLTNIILDFGRAGGTGSGFAGTDLNRDAVVDDGDLTELILYFGNGC